MTRVPDSLPKDDLVHQRWLSAAFARRAVAGTLLLVLLAAAGGVFVCFWRRATAIESIERAGGRVDTYPVRPRWLRALIGQQGQSLFGRIARINLEVLTATDRDLAAVGDLADAEELYIFSDEISDRGLEVLRRMHRLRVLQIGGPQVTDDACQYFENLDKLEELDLGFTQMTGSGLRMLPATRTLRILSLGQLPLGDENCRDIATFASLERLDLRDTKITDEGVASLASLPKLWELNLTATAVTDVGLRELRQMSSLKSVNIEQTHVTGEGVSELRIRYPKLAVQW